MLEQDPIVLEDYRDIPFISLDQFPQAEDLVVRLEGNTPALVDDRLGLNQPLPWWDRADAEQWARSEEGAPLGDVNVPFQDEEQGWRLLIWREGDFVYVLAGDEDAFHTWFRVPTDKYLSAWAAIV